jgi:hypothetical protein
MIYLDIDIRPFPSTRRDKGYYIFVDRMKEGSANKIEQKSFWSEEDEDNILMIEDKLRDFLDYIKKDHTLKKHVKNSLKEEIIENIDWLKSLRPQNAWKPSDKQINAIRLARSFVTDDFGANPTLSDTLVELLEQLKKLK